MATYSERKNILVIGGAGFIGANLCERLIERYNVICLDNYASGHESNIDYLLPDKHFEFIRHDITQPLDIAKASDGIERFQLQHAGIHHIYFTASPGSPDWYFANPLDTMMIHSVGVRNALVLAAQFHSRFLYVSDAVCYGMLPDGAFRPTEEFSGIIEHNSPLAFYIQARRFAETIVELFRTLHALDAKIIRLFPVYGPRMTLNDGRMVSQLISDALAGKQIAISKELNASVSSFLYVTDAIDGIEKAMMSDVVGLMNLGGGSQYTIPELLKKIVAHTSTRSAISVGEISNDGKKRMAAWEYQCMTPNLSRIKDATGWFPITLLDDGLRKTIDYLKSLRGMKGIVR